jgi:hypothetical protein
MWTERRSFVLKPLKSSFQPEEYFGFIGETYTVIINRVYYQWQKGSHDEAFEPTGLNFGQPT